MKMKAQRSLQYLLLAAFVALSVACGTTKQSTKVEDEAKLAGQAPEAGTMAQIEVYEVHHDGRIHVFYDRKLYNEFMEMGETPFRLTRIGAGPNGETLVFGLAGADKKHPEKVAAINLYDNKLEALGEIYGEMRRHGRIYVFSNFADMKPVRQFGHPNFFYTEIGAGPKGETVVFVLNSTNKKKRPDALIAKYKGFNS